MFNRCCNSFYLFGSKKKHLHNGQELESKYSSLSVRQANLEDVLKKRVDAIEKSAASIQANLNKATTAIKYIRSARKADNKKIESAITAIEKRLSPLPNDLANLTSELKNIDRASNEKLEKLSQIVGSTQNNLVSIRSIDQKTIDILLKNQQQTYQLALKKITSNLEDRIKSFEKKLKELEKVEKSPKN